MATSVIKAISAEGTHQVGKITAIKRETVPYGAVVTTADVDNFTLVEFDGFSADGDRQCKQLSAKANYGYLVSTAEFRPMNEELEKFYNEVGEKANLDILKPRYTTFRTSAYTKNTGVTTVVKGLVAHFDVATKKYILSTSASPHADYAGSMMKFEVIADEDDVAAEFNVDAIGLVIVSDTL